MVSKIVRNTLVMSLGTILCAAAGANPVSWSNSSGSESDFSYSNGRNDVGIAGDPVTVGDGFQFTVNHFKAESTNGGDDMVNETIHVTLTPAAGLRISSISANLTGDYSVLSPLAAASSGYSADLDVVKHGGSTHVSNSLSPSDFTTGADAISDGLTLNIPSTITGSIDLTFDASVRASSNPGSAATTELKLLQLGVTTMSSPPPAVPLPAAIATFPLGAAVAGWARKRMIKH